MKLHKDTALLYVPDNTEHDLALSRTTHLAIGAHPDDLEIMAYEPIATCYKQDNLHYTGVVVTNGSGSARENEYANYTDEEMVQVRRQEQIKASEIGDFNALLLLDYTSPETKDPKNDVLVNELKEIVLKTTPEVLYTHNLADKHETHIGVVTKLIKALRQIDKDKRPKRLLGCEVWRDLDWLRDTDKVAMDVSKHPELAKDLVEVFDSQITGGKRYDLATWGRRMANATFATAHSVDESDQVNYAMDLTPLILDDNLDVVEFISVHLDNFKNDVTNVINKIK